MSRAFVKETDGAEGQELPELQVSPHRNLVTPAGRSQIEATVERLQAALSAARAAEDRAGVARIQRDLRYWSGRQRTAEVVAAPALAAQCGSAQLSRCESRTASASATRSSARMKPSQPKARFRTSRRLRGC